MLTWFTDQISVLRNIMTINIIACLFLSFSHSLSLITYHLSICVCACVCVRVCVCVCVCDITHNWVNPNHFLEKVNFLLNQRYQNFIISSKIEND